MQNCANCGGKKWFTKIDKKTGKQLKNSRGALLWRCWRCGTVQTEPYLTVIPAVVRTGANILYLDVEISKSAYFNYGRRVPTTYLRPDDLIHEYYMICWAASYVGGKKVFSDCVSPPSARHWTDKQILRGLHDIMEGADIIAGHNVDSYDLKKINTRFLLNGLKPIDKPTIDSLKIARARFAFEANDLDSLCRRFGIKGKDKITNEDWLSIVRDGDKKTLEKVDKYCQGDVRNGKKMFEILLPYSRKKMNYGAVALQSLAKCK